jgi:DNA-binding transcriptional MerR regulator
MAASDEAHVDARDESQVPPSGPDNEAGPDSEAGLDSEDGRTRATGKSVTAFRTISEVSTDLEVPQHVLRFWESKFTQLRPLKRGGGRRYYRPEDIALLRRIHGLLYREGYTIKGVQQVLRNSRGSRAPVKALDMPVAPEPTIPGLPKPSTKVSTAFLGDLLAELRQLRRLLD